MDFPLRCYASKKAALNQLNQDSSNNDSTKSDNDGSGSPDPSNQLQIGPLQEQGSNDPDDVIPQRISLHSLQLDFKPHPRLLVQLHKGDAPINLTAAQAARYAAPGASSVLGATHNRAETGWSCTAGDIRIDIIPVPWREPVLIRNLGRSPLFVKHVPDGIDAFSIPVHQYRYVYPGSWQASDDRSSLQFRLRPRGYHLYLQQEASKRLHDDEGYIVPQAQKMVTRPRVIDSDALVNQLDKMGLSDNETLNVMDSDTGRIEYSIKCVNSYMQRNSSSDVFKAVWTEGSAQPAIVAVKFHKITNQLADTVAAIRHWKREFQMHKDLHHPHIVSLLGFDSRLLALMIEHRDSHDLTTPLWCVRSKNEFPFFKGSKDDARRILAHVSSGLAYLSEQGIIHNDIKPGNILYRAANPTSDRKAEAVIIDFGLARKWQTEPDDLGGGTPSYLAPEWLYQKQRNAPADVFSMGVVMLYLLGIIFLPDKGNQWDVNAIMNDEPTAVYMMDNWLKFVEKTRKSLQDTENEASGKEAKLLSLVNAMLLIKESDRIRAGDLATQTREWAS